MKFFRALFLLLVAGNLLMYAHGQGLLGSPQRRGEPERMASQLHPDRIRILPPGQAGPAAPAAEARVGCRELASLAPETALRIAEAVRPVADTVQLSQRVSEAAASYWVHIPPAPNRQEADRRLAQLKRLQIRDYYLVQDAGPNQYAISLGLFRSMDSATEALAGLRKAGVSAAQVAARQPSPQVTVVLRGPQGALAELLTRVTSETPGISPAECSPES